MAAKQSNITTDHDQIRHWVESRGGHPSAVRATSSEDDVGLLRIDFEQNGPEENLEEISWDEFFKKFEEKNLAFLYQDTTQEGQESRFFKFINREPAEERGAPLQHQHQQLEQMMAVEQQDESQQELQQQMKDSARAQRGPGKELKDKNLVKHLNNILREEIKVLDLLQGAIDQIEDDQVCEQLKNYCSTHEQQLFELENLVFGFGGEPTPLQEAGRTPYRSRSTH